MQIVYSVLCGLILWRIIHKNIDFVSVSAVSFILYSSNCLIGTVWVDQSGHYAYYSEINYSTYFLICMQLILIYFSLTKLQLKIGKMKSFEDTVSIERECIIKSNDNTLYWFALLLVSGLIIAYNIFFVIGISVFFSDMSKSAILKNVSIEFGLAIWGALLCFFHFYIIDNKIMEISSMMLLVFSFILGSRAYIAAALVGILIMQSFDYIAKKKSGGNRRIIILGIGLFFFLIIYKLVYREVRSGDFEAVFAVLSSPATWRELLDVGELRIICANYNYILENKINLPIVDVIARCISILPFANKLIEVEYPLRFSDILMKEMGTTYGLANNFWGEIYAMGGMLSVLIATIIWIAGIKYLNEKVKREKSPFLLTVVSYLSFYIHRLDWTQVMGCFKIVFLLFFLKVIMDAFLKSKIPKQTPNKISNA